MRRSKSEKMELAGKILSVVGNIFDAVINILLVVGIIYVIYKSAFTCYDYGYRIYTEAPVSTGEGREVTLVIPVDFTAKELGELFANNGLSNDHILCMLQYYASEYREDIKGGTYTLNTNMTVEEMFEKIANINIAKEEEQKALEEAAEKQNAKEEQAQNAANENSDEESGEDSNEIQNIDVNGDDLLGDTNR
ncbi:MAG: hypothetical protein MJ104_00505 [Lachnospiraceae bacterium]|nr:hypothetical protein [Lachnospiraceae bacterium]